jgi:hypothetical protein
MNRLTLKEYICIGSPGRYQKGGLVFLQRAFYIDREAIRPIPPHLQQILVITIIHLNNTDDNLPPYCAGIVPLYRVTFLIASELKVGKEAE